MSLISRQASPGLITPGLSWVAREVKSKCTGTVQVSTYVSMTKTNHIATPSHCLGNFPKAWMWNLKYTCVLRMINTYLPNISQ